MDFWTSITLIFISASIVYIVLGILFYKTIKKNPWFAVAGLFLIVLIIDIAIPDPLPLLDEIVLGFATFLTSKKALTGTWGVKK